MKGAHCRYIVLDMVKTKSDDPARIFAKILAKRAKRKSWKTLIESLQKFTDDFMEKGRNHPPIEKRKRALRES